MRLLPLLFAVACAGGDPSSKDSNGSDGASDQADSGGGDGGDTASGGDDTGDANRRVTIQGEIHTAVVLPDSEGRLLPADDISAGTDQLWVAAVEVAEDGFPGDPPNYLAETLSTQRTEGVHDFSLELPEWAEGAPYRLVTGHDSHSDGALSSADIFGGSAQLHAYGQTDPAAPVLYQSLPPPEASSWWCEETVTLRGTARIALDSWEDSALLVLAVAPETYGPTAAIAQIDAEDASPGSTLDFELEVCRDQGSTGVWVVGDSDGLATPVDDWGALADGDTPIEVGTEDIDGLELVLDGELQPPLPPSPVGSWTGPLHASEGLTEEQLAAPARVILLPVHPSGLDEVSAEVPGSVLADAQAPTSDAAGSYSIVGPTNTLRHMLAWLDVDEDGILDEGEPTGWPDVGGEYPVRNVGLRVTDYGITLKAPD